MIHIDLLVEQENKGNIQFGVETVSEQLSSNANIYSLFPFELPIFKRPRVPF